MREPNRMLACMDIDGQAGRRGRSDLEGGRRLTDGRLLVVLASWRSALRSLPAWRQMIQREREDELIFRGQQYVRAISLYQRKFGPTFPPNLDILVEQNCPPQEIQGPGEQEGGVRGPLPGVPRHGDARTGCRGSARPGLVGYPSGSGWARPSECRSEPGLGGEGHWEAPARPVRRGGAARDPACAWAPAPRRGLGGQRGGVVGVVSKSAEKSVRTYAGRNYYNEWQFVFLATGQGGVGGTGILTGIPGQPRGPGALPIGVGRGGRAGTGRSDTPAGGRGSGRGIGPGIVAPGGSQRGPGFGPGTTQPQPTGRRGGN